MRVLKQSITIRCDLCGKKLSEKNCVNYYTKYHGEILDLCSDCKMFLEEYNTEIAKEDKRHVKALADIEEIYQVKTSLKEVKSKYE